MVVSNSYPKNKSAAPFLCHVTKIAVLLIFFLLLKWFFPPFSYLMRNPSWKRSRTAHFWALFESYVMNHFHFYSRIPRFAPGRQDFPFPRCPTRNPPCPPLLKGGWGGFQRWVGQDKRSGPISGLFILTGSTINHVTFEQSPILFFLFNL